MRDAEAIVEQWWADSVGYQVYISSFADSDGDGLGDLRGVTDRLPYLRDLGVNAVWITPFYPSPQLDNGYDVSDYTDVDPRFGDLAEFDELVARAHGLGLHVMIDFVVNHTSDQHDWFVRASSDPASPERDMYVWRKPAAGGVPNNWVSHFGGPAWTFDEASAEYYLHLFLPEQPELNWASPLVAERIDDVFRFWIGRGIDGIRIDTAQLFTKHPEMPDNPLADQPEADRDGTGASLEWESFDHLHDMDQHSNTDVFKRWRRITEPAGAMTVGEVYILDPERLMRYVDGNGLDMSFFFTPVNLEWDPERLLDCIGDAVDEVAAGPKLSWVLSSHDSSRAVSRFGGGDTGRARALALHTLLFCLPGMPFLWQGEELGLENVIVSPAETQDPMPRRTGLYERSRDPGRTPIPWTLDPGRGWRTDTPLFLPMGPRQDSDTVEWQLGHAGSWLQRYRELIALRREHPELFAGSVRWQRLSPAVVDLRRHDHVRLVANLSDTPVLVDAGGWDLAYSTTGQRNAGVVPPTSTSVWTSVR